MSSPYCPVFPDLQRSSGEAEQEPAWLKSGQQPRTPEVSVWSPAGDQDDGLIHETAEQRQQALEQARQQGYQQGQADARQQCSEALKQQLHQEIFEHSHQQGFDAGHSEGYQSGLEAAQPDIDQQLKLLQQLTQQQDLWQQARDQQQQVQLQELICALVREVSLAELKLQPEAISRAIATALEIIPGTTANPIISLNPEDRAAAEAFCQSLQGDWKLVEDTTIEPGGCRVATEHSDVDASVDWRLEQAINRVREVFQDAS